MSFNKQCPICLNEDPTYFFLGSKGWYCRKCVSLRLSLIDNPQEISSEVKIIETQYQLPFSLSDKQIELAEKLVTQYQQYNTLIYAACGAGKTELVLNMLVDGLKRGYRFGWAIPRRTVVLQLCERLKSYFPNIKIIPVCQGFTEITDGDLIICTTHQLYRYYQYFDYLILDEPDAYPFSNNPLLQNISITSTRKKQIYLTATPDDFILSKSEVTLELFARPHGYPIIVPKEICTLRWCGIIIFTWLLVNRTRKTLVFFPSIKMANIFYRVFRYVFALGVISSKTVNKEEIIHDFINSKFQILFATTILERGVTIANIDVIVWQANHRVFDLASLIQMTGRVGRTNHHPFGNAYLMTSERSEKVKRCLQIIENMNQNA